MMEMLKWILIVAIAVLIGSCTETKESAMIDNSLDVSWSVQESDGKHRVSFQIVNTSDIVLKKDNWKLYFNQITGAANEQLTPKGARIEHVSGYFFALAPTDDFVRLAPGDSVEFTYLMDEPLSRYSFVPEGMYVVIENREPYTIPTPFVSYYERGLPEEIRGDSPNELFEQYKPLRLLSEEQLGIIPTPVSVKTRAGVLELTELSIGFEPGMENEANHLGRRLSKFHKGSISLAGNLQEGNIRLIRDKGITNSEGYVLNIQADGIEIRANDNKGLFYGTQSLVGLLPVKGAVDTLKIPLQTITDHPRFAYRGLHIDMARNFKSKESVLKILDLMAYYKLNKLNLQLTDDEGWRIQVDALPELTSIGSRRGHTEDESDRLFPAYGSGPNPVDDEMGGTGFYSKEDFIEIIRFAAANHIEVIPKIDVPGHNRAAIIAMKARYDRIMKESGNETLASEYLLTDPNDQSSYMSVQGYNDNVVCVCMESTYRFIETVVDEITGMYHEAGVPITVIHIGGDEVPGGVWEESPICREMIEKEGMEGTKNELAAYFVGRVTDILNRRGLITSGWEEIVMIEEDETLVPNPDFVDKPIVPYAWHKEFVNPLANAGFKVIMGNANSLYFDMAYDKDPFEPGLTWAGMVGADETFNLDPYRLKDVDEELKAPENILGLQAQTWGETIWNEERLEYYLFPKLIALSERAWSQEPMWARNNDTTLRNREWNRFTNTMAQKEFDRLENLTGGLVIRLPKPGLQLIDGRIHANVAFPGLDVRYTLDSSEPNYNSPLYSEPIEAGGVFKAKAFHGDNSSSTSTLTFK